MRWDEDGGEEGGVRCNAGGRGERRDMGGMWGVGMARNPPFKSLVPASVKLDLRHDACTMHSLTNAVTRQSSGRSFVSRVLHVWECVGDSQAVEWLLLGPLCTKPRPPVRVLGEKSRPSIPNDSHLFRASTRRES